MKFYPTLASVNTALKPYINSFNQFLIFIDQLAYRRIYSSGFLQSLPIIKNFNYASSKWDFLFNMSMCSFWELRLNRRIECFQYNLTSSSCPGLLIVGFPYWGLGMQPCHCCNYWLPR